MRTTIKHQVSAESDTYLDEMRKVLSAIRRAVPKDEDPAMLVESLNSYNLKITAKWSTWA